MQTEPTQAPVMRARLHPIAIIAGISVIALSAVGISVLLYNRTEAKGAPQTLVAKSGAVSPGETVAPPPAGFDNTAPVNHQAAPVPAAASAAYAPAGSNAVPYPPPPAPAGPRRCRGRPRLERRLPRARIA